MLKTICESGMEFGPFQEEYCFYIEKSNIYVKLQNGLPIAEFLFFMPEKNKLFIVEAKSSSPRPNNSDTENKFDTFINDISDKLINALSLGLSLCINRHKKFYDELSQPFKSLALDSLDIILVLVINGHKDDWLIPINEALQVKLRCASKTWPLSVIAINEKDAMKYGLIRETV